MRNLIDKIKKFFEKKEKPETDRDRLTNKLIEKIGDSPVTLIREQHQLKKESFFMVQMESDKIKVTLSSVQSLDSFEFSRTIFYAELWINDDKVKPEHIDCDKIYNFVFDLHKSQELRKINQTVESLN